MTRAELIPLIKQLLAVYPNNGITDVKSLVDGWEMIFGEDNAETVYKAARLHMQSCKWFPKAAEIKERLPYAGALFNDQQQAIEEPAVLALDDGKRTGCDFCPYGPLNSEMCLGWDKCDI